MQVQRLIDTYKKSGNLHHAYFLVGDGEEIFLKLKNFLSMEVGVETVGNPDFWYGKYNTLNIENARLIAESQERKSFDGSPSSRAPQVLEQSSVRDRELTTGLKIFIIQADFITEEAQNSLLKVFEEPTVGTHFFIISPQDVLLPTLRSRMVVIQVESYKAPTVLSGSRLNASASKILAMSVAERLVKVKEITDAISDEEKTKQDAIALLNQIESELYKSGVEKNSKSLEICEQARASLYDRGAPIKMILENLLLSV